MHSVNDEFPPFVLNGVDSNQDMVSVNSTDLEGWRVFYFYPKNQLGDHNPTDAYCQPDILY